ncbi:hypothetical protein A2U01_0035515, partial [Trifolium medium]|nr:hypothetical protein [Trifolium medium]
VQEREFWFWLRRIAPGSIARCAVLRSFEVDLLWSRCVAQLNAARCAIHVLDGALRRRLARCASTISINCQAIFRSRIGPFWGKLLLDPLSEA